MPAIKLTNPIKQAKTAAAAVPVVINPLHIINNRFKDGLSPASPGKAVLLLRLRQGERSNYEWSA